jgi:hypothetical protein
MKMYLLNRVLEAESKPDFSLHQLNSGARAQCAAKCYEAKSKALTELARQIPIEVPTIALQELKARTQSQLSNNPLEQHRMELLFLIEQYKVVEWVLDDFFWHPGIRAARVIIRRRILVDVMEKYPHLNDVALAFAKMLNGNSDSALC